VTIILVGIVASTPLPDCEGVYLPFFEALMGFRLRGSRAFALIRIGFAVVILGLFLDPTIDIDVVVKGCKDGKVMLTFLTKNLIALNGSH